MDLARYRFKINALVALFAVVSVSCLIALGVWQLKRAHEKERLLSQQAAQAKLPVTDWQPNLPLKNYQQVRVCGTYWSTFFLLDNQYSSHKVGYNVLTPLMVGTNSVVIVDRGWVQASLSREQLPKITTPEFNQCLTGQVYYPSKKSMLLGDNLEKKNDLTIIEALDIKLMSHLLHKTVYPYIIRLNKKERYGFTRNWITVNMMPARHRAYAYQWFTMAFVLSMLFLGLIVNKRRDEKI